jgi:hypothetical protein
VEEVNLLHGRKLLLAIICFYIVFHFVGKGAINLIGDKNSKII